jgi:hypothetical protein
LANLIDGKLSKGSEVINGTDADDYIRPLGGSDFIDGKKGFDTVYVYWPSSKFKVTTIQGTTYLDAISGASSSDKVVLRNVEQVEFSDKTLSLEIADAYVNTVGSDSFDGGPGVDTMVYKGASTDYALKSKSSGLDVTRLDYTEGSDYLQGIERIQFNDKSVAFDIDGRAGIAAKTLSLVFGKEAVGVPAYVGICLDFLDNKSYSASQLMNEALKIRLGTKASDAGQVVDFLYERLMGTLPTPEAKSLYVGWIQNQTYSIEGLAVYASNLSLNPVASDLVGLVTTGLFYIPVSTNG